MQCPVDGETLVMTERSGVEIDYCPKCRGVWLDRGELDKIIDRAAPSDGARPVVMSAPVMPAPGTAAPVAQYPAPPPQSSATPDLRSQQPYRDDDRRECREHHDDRGNRDHGYRRDHDDGYRHNGDRHDKHGRHRNKHGRGSFLSNLFDHR